MAQGSLSRFWRWLRFATFIIIASRIDIVAETAGDIRSHGVETRETPRVIGIVGRRKPWGDWREIVRSMSWRVVILLPDSLTLAGSMPRASRLRNRHSILLLRPRSIFYFLLRSSAQSLLIAPNYASGPSSDWRSCGSKRTEFRAEWTG